ncbi:MAG: hypothetical protein RMK32_05990 [Anaerolineae bacterium]|nr:hypothetical protein [Thermoflexus sp.]MDW8065163.1 hypothetical protein [Anaerolineae bacterium]
MDASQVMMTIGSWILAAGPCILAAGLALVWAISEILQTFQSDPYRALRSRWAMLFIATHVVFILTIYLIARRLNLSSDPWLLAIATGVGGEVLLRIQVNLLQPLDPQVSQAVSLSMADLYARFQQFYRKQIDRQLAIGRLLLLRQAVQIPPEELENLVRLYGHASVLHSHDRVEEYLAKLRQKSSEERVLYLASYLLREAGFAFLQAQLKAIQKR